MDITKCTFLNFASEGRTETLQLTNFPQLLVAYIQNKYIYVTKCTFPNLVPKGHIETLQMEHIPQMLAAYIQYKYIYYRMYFPQPCAQKMHRNPPNYTIPPIFGRIYPIPIFRFN